MLLTVISSDGWTTPDSQSSIFKENAVIEQIQKKIGNKKSLGPSGAIQLEESSLNLVLKMQYNKTTYDLAGL